LVPGRRIIGRADIAIPPRSKLARIVSEADVVRRTMDVPGFVGGA
jgi:hypothetical protein